MIKVPKSVSNFLKMCKFDGLSLFDSFKYADERKEDDIASCWVICNQDLFARIYLGEDYEEAKEELYKIVYNETSKTETLLTVSNLNSNYDNNKGFSDRYYAHKDDSGKLIIECDDTSPVFTLEEFGKSEDLLKYQEYSGNRVLFTKFELEHNKVLHTFIHFVKKSGITVDS